MAFDDWSFDGGSGDPYNYDPYYDPNAGGGGGGNGGYTPDENGGFWDSQGGYYDSGGGYFAPDGSYTDSEGNQYQAGQDGNYQLVGGGGGGGGLGGALRGVSDALKPIGGAIGQFYKDNPLLGTLLNFGAGRALENYDQGRFDARQNQARGQLNDWVSAQRNEKPRYALDPRSMAPQITGPTNPSAYGRGPNGGEQLMYNQANPLAMLSGYDTRSGGPMGGSSPASMDPSGAFSPNDMAYAGGSPGFNEAAGGTAISGDAGLSSPSPALAAAAPPAPMKSALGALAPTRLGARPVNRTGALAYATGGPVDGPGGGQDDRIPALLSAGEYVVDASTVSDLGDGSNAAGSRRLDALRRNVRSHKKTGRFPPKARAVGSYMGD